MTRRRAVAAQKTNSSSMRRAHPPMGVTMTFPATLRLTLLGLLLSACSQPASAATDRWCAFSLPGNTDKDTELWVIDVARAIAGPVACDGTSPSCLRLTSNLWTGQTGSGPSHPTTHRFEGETLIFHADSDPDVDEYRGPIYAWRPGWPAARQISGPTAYSCTAHAHAETVVCIENLSDPNDPVFTFELHGGPLGMTPLPLLGKIVPLKP